MDRTTGSTYPLGSCQVGKHLEGGNILRTAIWISGVVNRIHADEDVVSLSHLSESEGERQKDGISRRDVRHWYIDGPLFVRATLRYVNIRCECGTTKRAKVDIHQGMAGDSQFSCDTTGCSNFARVSLTIRER